MNSQPATRKEIKSALKEQNIHVAFENECEFAVNYKNVMYILTFQGEISITKVNFGHIGDVPTTYFGDELNANTIVYRTLAVLNGKSIDYQLRLENTTAA